MILLERIYIVPIINFRSSSSILALTLSLSIVTSAFAANPFRRSNFELAPNDMEFIEAAGAKLYTDASRNVGDVELWRNDTSGNYGSIELVLVHATRGLPCRRLQHDIKLSASPAPYRFIIDRCKTEDGSWKFL